MTCKCPKKWCYQRPDCRVAARHAYLKQLEQQKAPPAPTAREFTRAASDHYVEAKLATIKRKHRRSTGWGPRTANPHAAALAAIERAIDRLHHATMGEPMRGLRLVQLYARRDELAGGGD